MKEGLRSGSAAAQLERRNEPSGRVVGRRRRNEVINSGGLESGEKGLNSNYGRCSFVISSDLEAIIESTENATVSSPKESVKTECECEEVCEPGWHGRKRGRKIKSECREDGIGDRKKVKGSLKCKVEVVGRVLRSRTITVQAVQMKKNGSGKEVDSEQSESNMVDQRRSGSAHFDKKRGMIEEVNSDGSAGDTRKKLKGKQGRAFPVERKRGRPPKGQGKKVVSERVLDKKEEASRPEKLKRKRGRPPKVQQENEALNRVVVKKEEGMGSKRDMRASKFDGIVRQTGPNNHVGRESSTSMLNENSKAHGLGIQEHETSSGVGGEGEVGESAKHEKGKGGDGRAAEKQLVREQIIDMLMRAGWTIDYRPRRSKLYNDAVYISPLGRAYWSITLAYNVLKSLYEDGHCEPGFTFTPIPDGVLTKLKRNASKGKKRRLKLEQEYDSDGEITKGKSGKSKQAWAKSSDCKMKGKSSHSGQDNLTRPTSVRNRKLQRTQSTKRFALLARNSKVGLSANTDGYVPYSGKQTLLSWMIDLGTVSLNGKVQYMNRRKTRPLLEGRITRDGILCSCCSEILTVSEFEIHAGTKLCEPSQNIILESGISLLQCQLDSWNKQKESERSGFHLVDSGADDPNDDTCGICGDGGDLICCDGCPSTFHQSCLDIQKFPSGDWHCIYCSCKFCGMFNGNTDEMNDKLDANKSTLLSCLLCEEKYHHMCTQEEDAILEDSTGPFCGKACRELFERRQVLFGVKHELEDGFSCTFVQRTEVGLDTSLNGITRKVECNSKLAVALSIMDECFLPIVDQRSGINLIRNVLYNCGSNFNRLNYGGFFTAILERGEEIISTASIRIHGSKLAEMPFIGTRHIYRRQGMCRRLLNAIESALRSLNVEKLVIPAVSELFRTWTSVFGFKPLEVSSKKEMRNMNMLVFHGTDMLQKPLLKDQLAEESMIPGTVLLESNELRKDLDNKHQVADNSDLNISSKSASLAEEIYDGPLVVESGSQINEGSLNHSFDITSETESASDEKGLVHDNLEGENSNTVSPQPSACDAHALNVDSGTEEVNEYQTAVDESVIPIPDLGTVELHCKLNEQLRCDEKKKPHGASCFVSEETGREKEAFRACKEGKEADCCELKNGGSIVKPSNDSLENETSPEHWDADLLHGSCNNIPFLGLEARSQMYDDAKDGKNSNSEQLQAIANDPCIAVLAGCHLERLCQSDEPEDVAATVDVKHQSSHAVTEPNEHCQSMELASSLDKNEIPESKTCGMSHQTASKLSADDFNNCEESLSSYNDCPPPDRPQVNSEPDSVVGHSSPGSGVALPCGSGGGCKAGGAPEVMVVSNQAS